MTLHEPAVALTDLGLALENAVFVVLLARQHPAEAALRRGFLCLFAALALAALLGFATHGLIAEPASTTRQAVWVATLLSVGLVALAAAAIGARLLWRADTARVVTRFAVALTAAYALAVLAGERYYGLALLVYLPSTLLLLAAFWKQRARVPTMRAGIAGLMLTWVAAGVQHSGLGLHPVWFNHNALYHVLQALALGLIYLAARGLLRAPGPA